MDLKRKRLEALEKAQQPKPAAAMGPNFRKERREQHKKREASTGELYFFRNL